MVSITIRGVPDEVRNELASRAALAGQSLQEHLRAQLIALAQRPSADALLAKIRNRKQLSGTSMAAETILKYRNEDRK